MSRLLVLASAFLGVAWLTVNAEVIESADGGFLVRNEAVVMAPAERVFNTLTERIGMWWESSHTFSGDARNLSIEPRAGGCFCERLSNGGSVRHLSVIYVDPGKELRLEGALGPLQQAPVTGVMIWRLTESGSGTRVALSYAVGGYRPGGVRPLAMPVDGVLHDQLARLKRFVETGRTQSQ
jgi:uncharacterized protein YndB with AHSA1/START domain